MLIMTLNDTDSMIDPQITLIRADFFFSLRESLV